MAYILGAGRPAYLGAALASATFLLASCASIVPAQLQVAKFYFKDYTLNVAARHMQGEASTTFEDAKKKYLQEAKNAGILYSPNYAFVADPVLYLSKTEPVSMPDSQTVEETVIVNGKAETQKVLRKPIFYIDRATVTYQVPGYDIPAATYELQIPIKSNEYQLSLPAVAQAGPLMTAFSRDPASLGAVSGTVTVTAELRDLDPLASERTFKVARTLPLVYSYTQSRPEDLKATPTPDAPPATPAPTPTPSVSPSPSPSPSPTPSAVAS